MRHEGKDLGPRHGRRWLTAIAIGALALSPVVVGADQSPAFASSDPCTTKFPGYTAGLTTISGGDYHATTNPYKIESEENLVWVSWASSSLNTAVSPAVTRAVALAASYKQTANIDLEGCNWTPIGSGTSFTGTFDGQGLTITGLTIPGTPPDTTAPDNQGMFGQTSRGANLKNIGLVNVSVTGSENVGGLVGYNNRGTIRNSYATGEVTGGEDVGGLVGENDGTIRNSYATGEVTVGDYLGGLVGYNNSGAITDSYATGNVIGDDYLGGLVGYNDDGGTITNSSATGEVTGDESDYLGGLVGANDGTIEDSSATGEVTGGYDVGGLVGDNDGTIEDSSATGKVTGSENVGGLVGDNKGTIEDSSATGEVTGDEDVGGLVGENHPSGTVTSSYATGAVTALFIGYAGGLVGWNDEGTITNSYATGQVTGKDKVGGLVGDNNGTITNSYATGGVDGNADVGGLVGDNDEGTITNSYATGVVAGPIRVGGLVGAASGETVMGAASGETVTNSFWDTETSRQAASAGGTGVIGKITAEMKAIATFTGPGWPIISGWQAFDGSTRVWGICGAGSDFNRGYPYLLWQASSDPCGTGSGSSGSSATSAGTPGIFLHITGPVGRSVAGSPVYYGADRVQVTSTYTLTLTPVGGKRPPVTMLAEGTIELNDSFSTSVRLDPLAPGSYDVQFTGTHRNGATLELTSRIVVGPGGEYTLIGDNIPIIR